MSWVIPQQYNSYLAAVGGIDALGTIDPVLLANASFSLSAHGAGVYGDYSLVSVRAAALRVQDIITRIGETEGLHEAIALNTYARAELARAGRNPDPDQGRPNRATQRRADRLGGSASCRAAIHGF